VPCARVPGSFNGRARSRCATTVVAVVGDRRLGWVGYDWPHLREVSGEVLRWDTEEEGHHVGGLSRREVVDDVPQRDGIDAFPCDRLDTPGVRCACRLCVCVSFGRRVGASPFFCVASHARGGLRGVGAASLALFMGPMLAYVASRRLDGGLFIPTAC